MHKAVHGHDLQSTYNVTREIGIFLGQNKNEQKQQQHIVFRKLHSQSRK